MALFNYPTGLAVDSAGDVYVADTYNSTMRKVTSGGVVTTLAGIAGQSGSMDGPGSTAKFNFPRSVAVDNAGNVYVADSGNNTIRKISTNGVVSTLAGSAGKSGSVDGIGSAALFFYPSGVAVDSAGNVYVADLDNNTIRKVTALGVVTTLAGLAQFDHFGTPIGGSADGTGSNALFNYPASVTVDNAGNVYVADTGNSTIRKVTSGGVVTTLAGNPEQAGSADGAGSAAEFDYPYAVTVDSGGHLYVADSGNNTIRTIETNGVVTTLAGSVEQIGSTDIIGTTARFNNPVGLAVDSAGYIYVADTGNSIIRKLTSNGLVTALAGSAGLSGSANGTNSMARFNNPSGLVADSVGNLYVADSGNNTIRMVTSSGVVTTLAGSAGQSGNTDGTNGVARFKNPTGVAVDSAGNAYVTDSGNNTIRMVTSGGVVTTLAGSAGQSGSTDGTNSTARFNFPAGIAMDSAGSLYVGDSGNKTIRQVMTNGVVTTLAGSAELSGSADGTNSSARFAYPFGVTVDPAGNLYVTDTSNFTVRELTPAGVVTTLAGNAGLSGSADGTGKAARFYVPTGVAVNSAGIIYVADTGNSTIRKVTSGGMVTTLAGRAKQTGSVDNTNYQATYFSPGGVAVDNAGNVYVADTYNSTIRKVTSDGGVATLAGSAGLFGSGDGAGSSALFNFPSGVAVDNVGNVYVADSYNSTIRKVTDDGVVATLAGSPGLSGSLDGTGSIARFFDPSSVAVDSAGNVYVTDSGNNTIRKISSSGLVTTLAGSAAASGSADGTGSAARFFNPNGVAVDSAGNVYVADSGNNLVRKITSAGVVTTLAGNAGQSGGADGTNSTALFNFPCNVAVDSAGNVYVADSGNNTIRKVTSGGVVTTIGGNTGVMGGADGLGSWAKFARPRGIAVDGSGRVYVADTGNNRISLGRPLPTINIKKLAMNVVVFWPASFNDLVLQQNFNVSNPIGWSTSSYTNSDDGTNKSVTISSPSANQFFRLMAK